MYGEFDFQDLFAPGVGAKARGAWKDIYNTAGDGNRADQGCHAEMPEQQERGCPYAPDRQENIV